MTGWTLEVPHRFQRVFVGKRRLRETFRPLGRAVIKDEGGRGIRKERIFRSLAMPIDEMVASDRLPEDLGRRSHPFQLGVALALPSSLNTTLATWQKLPVREQMIMAMRMHFTMLHGSFVILIVRTRSPRNGLIVLIST